MSDRTETSRYFWHAEEVLPGKDGDQGEIRITWRVWGREKRVLSTLTRPLEVDAPVSWDETVIHTFTTVEERDSLREMATALYREAHKDELEAQETATRETGSA
jgi:hypothetical protein